MRIACDTGGTFTDLIVESDDGQIKMYKAATVPQDPVQGMLDAATVAAGDWKLSLPDFLGRCDLLIHGTTHAINAIITGRTARTAFLTTAGHPDILVLREGGRAEPFNFHVPYPSPYIPRALTFEIPERINAAGAIVTALDEEATGRILDDVAASGVEAIAVCLLWAIANPVHELRIGDMIRQRLPDVPFTLAHQLNPTLREYRRASAAAIDSSLKPLMGRYLSELTSRLASSGFKGRTLVLTSQGGMMDAAELAKQPIHAINSGPSMAPIAGRYYGAVDSKLPLAIVADTGGTTYDVSLVRRGRIPKTRETWIGKPYRGHMTGLPSIDIKSVGAGGGSIARVDKGGLLHVGPQSAGSVPGPVCYAAGGTQPTLTDACLVLGYLDPTFFLGGRMKLDPDAARQAIESTIAAPLKLDLYAAAAAIVEVATENMVQAIEEITINQGIDPSEAALIGGGGAAGFNSVWIARRLNCPLLIMPETGAALSAAGALMSELRDEYREMFLVTSDAWNEPAVNSLLAKLRERCVAFVDRAGASLQQARIEFAVEARYAGQVWEIELPLKHDHYAGEADLAGLLEDFHAHHEDVFAVRDPSSVVEFVCWTAAVSCPLGRNDLGRMPADPAASRRSASRQAFFAGSGIVETPVFALASLPEGDVMRGPAIVETPFTTIVIDPRASFWHGPSGSLLIKP
ncbi:MAG: hydantoinase/oxoprolinase family protein [Pseudolabrys sp.]|nr:hydantoinase/oxoprolinase family protein [Pseudolabrys sp.]